MGCGRVGRPRGSAGTYFLDHPPEGGGAFSILCSYSLLFPSSSPLWVGTQEGHGKTAGGGGQACAQRRLPSEG